MSEEKDNRKSEGERRLAPVSLLGGKLRNTVRSAIKDAMEGAIEDWYEDFVEAAKTDLTVEIFGDNGGEIHVGEWWDCGNREWMKMPLSKAVDNYIETFKEEDDKRELYANLADSLESQARRLRSAA